MQSHEAWPHIPYPAWRPTCTTLHLWTQIVGKFRLAHTPWLNHSWHATLYVTARGLATSLVPCGPDAVEAEFDFVEQILVVRTSRGGRRALALEPGSIAAFHAAFRAALAELGVDPDFHGRPNEVPDPRPFAEDDAPRDYDPAAARRFWLALVQIERVFARFRTGFLGKVSPVHLFWGSFDLAMTRFSGRPAPPHPGGIPALPDAVTREAYSHEVSSAGFWPGGGGIDEPAFYSYAYPTPDGFPAARIAPAAAFFSRELGEFVLPYEAVRTAPDPDAELMAFLESSYAVAADLAGWDRPALEAPLGRPGVPRAA